MFESLKEDYNNPRKFCKKCKAVKKDCKPQTSIIKSDNGDLLTKIVEQLRNHFDELLNNNSTNGSIVKYERMIYQTVDPELTVPKLEEIEFKK